MFLSGHWSRIIRASGEIAQNYQHTPANFTPIVLLFITKRTVRKFN